MTQIWNPLLSRHVAAVGLLLTAVTVAVPARATEPIRLLDDAIGCLEVSDANHLLEAILADNQQTVLDLRISGSCRDLAGHWAKVITTRDYLVFTAVSSKSTMTFVERMWIPVTYVAAAAKQQGLID